ncbi:CD3324 family protein [Paenibacillus alvei]|uniref:CD3324 family protein n=1 Tax=Paenibacillus alvei TaxID=44250 RepID=UPI0022810563|nr:CD3324 family protein [Paenibacillus alvei]
MKYMKANECLPEHLLLEIQKYVCGEFIYIPAPQGSRKKWGENSGIRRELQVRNEKIRHYFCEGASIDQLSEQYCLSVDSIKKIVYKK